MKQGGASIFRLAVVASLLAHGSVHVMVWGPTTSAEARGTDPDHSWLFGDQHSLMIGLMSIAAALFIIAGIALLARAHRWRFVATAAAASSLGLLVLFPGAILDAWLVAPVAIDLGLIAGILRSPWFSDTRLGIRATVRP